MKIALLGSTGMLGSKLAEVLKAGGHAVLAPSHAEVDLGRPHTLEHFFKNNPFDVLANCAAFTRVDACEESAKFSMAKNVNGTAVGWLAKFCRGTGRTLLHFSTDYVFDGQKGDPYLETDEPRPLNVYGRTKWQGEKLLVAEKPHFYLIRASWLYGPGGNNFVKTISALLNSKARIEVVSDQLGGPTYTGDLARFALELLEKKADPGLYHFSNDGQASWFEFAGEIKKLTGNFSCEVVPVASENIFRPAQRPADSRLQLLKAAQAVGHPPRPWQDALSEFLAKEFKLEEA